jgi:hypothetical protein
MELLVLIGIGTAALLVSHFVRIVANARRNY